MVKLVNHGPAELHGQLRLQAPKGWKTIEPEQSSGRLEAGGEAAYRARLVSPRGPLPVGPVGVEATWGDPTTSPAPIAFDRLTLEIPESLLLTPHAAEVVDAQQQKIVVDVKNLGQTPVEGTLSIQLSPAADPTGKRITAEAAFGPIEPNKTVEVKVEFLGPSLATSGWHATYAATYNGLMQTLEDDLLPIRNWQVVGPFPNPQGKGFRKEFPPEKGVDPKGEYPVGRGEVVRWKPARGSTSGFVHLNPLFEQQTAACAYAVIYVKSPTARKAVIWAGSNDGCKIWLNGRQVYSVLRMRKPKLGQDRVEVQLQAGWNEVLLKVPQRQGQWGFYFDLRTPDGQPMTDLVYEPTKK